MVSKKNFHLNSRIMAQQRPGVRAPAPYKKPFKAPIQLFSASQIPDDPGYVDFNNPQTLPPISNATGAANTPPHTKTPQQQQQQQKKKTNKMKQKNKQDGRVGNVGGNHMNGMVNANWSKKNPNLMLNGGGVMRGVNGVLPRGFVEGRCDPVRPIRGRGGGVGRMVPGMPRGGPMAPIVPPPPPPPIHGFQPPPMIPPMGAPLGRGPMRPIPPMAKGPGPLPPPRAFMHRNGHKMPPIPPPMPPILMPPRLPRNVLPPVAPFTGAVGKIKKPNPKLVKKVIKSKSSIKTLKNLVNQYPLDKPWVTDDLKSEYDKKVDIENRLKGNKNDELFAQFKAQRDKFVSLYETAREEYLKKEAAAVKAKDVVVGKNEKQTLKQKNTADPNNGNQNQTQNEEKSKTITNIKLNEDDTNSSTPKQLNDNVSKAEP